MHKIVRLSSFSHVFKYRAIPIYFGNIISGRSTRYDIDPIVSANIEADISDMADTAYIDD